MLITKTKHDHPTNCPSCGYELSGSTGIVDGTRPTPGDVSVCISCGVFLEYDANLNLVTPSMSEADILLEMDDDTRNIVVKARTFIARRGRLRKR